MKIEGQAFFLIVAVLFFAACKDEGARVNSAGADKTANQQTPAAVDFNEANAGAETNNNADQTAADDAGFAGTAGITDKKGGTQGVAVLRAVRSARHAGYDRLVFEFEGAELPDYHIEYVDRPVRQCGSGKVVELPGSGWLEISFTPARAHTDTGAPTVKDRRRSPNHEIIRGLASVCDFEAVVTWVAGVAAPNRYRVLELKDPARLVIDIKHQNI